MNKRIKILHVLLLFFIPVKIYSQSSDLELQVQRIKNTLGCDDNLAYYLINQIDSFATNIQNDFTYIASSEGTIEDKNKWIEHCLNNFTSPNALIGVSQIGSYEIKRYYISDYLKTIANIRVKNKYFRVQLMFLPDYLGMGRIERVSNSTNEYELSISMWQLFKAWFKIDDKQKLAYSDATKKKFRLKIYTDSDNHITKVKIDEIIVVETTTIERLKNKIKKEDE